MNLGLITEIFQEFKQKANLSIKLIQKFIAYKEFEILKLFPQTQENVSIQFVENEFKVVCIVKLKNDSIKVSIFENTVDFEPNLITNDPFFPVKSFATLRLALSKYCELLQYNVERKIKYLEDLINVK